MGIQDRDHKSRESLSSVGGRKNRIARAFGTALGNNCFPAIEIFVRQHPFEYPFGEFPRW